MDAAPLSPVAATSPDVVVLLAVPAADVPLYPSGAVPTVTAHTTAAAMEKFDRLRPRVVVVDWDDPAIDGPAICQAVTVLRSPNPMVTTAGTAGVPAALRAGCQAVLLKPFAMNLAAARLGRLCREASAALSPMVRAAVERGTNRRWPAVACPECKAGNAVSFDHASHRRWWYACLACNHVWLGLRQE